MPRYKIIRLTKEELKEAHEEAAKKFPPYLDGSRHPGYHEEYIKACDRIIERKQNDRKEI